jgi:hypothetical protein
MKPVKPESLILNILKAALCETVQDRNLKFVAPSRYVYGGGAPYEAAMQTWQERMFAYELYHQLRLIWDKDPKLADHSLIHADISKGYQKIKDFDYMPDLLFHLPQPGQNCAVLEIKLAKRSPDTIRCDLKKLVRFVREMEYEDAIEVLIGNEDEFKHLKDVFVDQIGIPIHLFYVFLDKRRIEPSIIQFDR